MSDKVQSFVDGEVETLPIGTFQEIRGVLGHSLTWAPGIARIILPRIDSALSQAPKTFPDQSTFPKGFIAAPLLRDGIIAIFKTLEIREKGGSAVLGGHRSDDRHYR